MFAFALLKCASAGMADGVTATGLLVVHGVGVGIDAVTHGPGVDPKLGDLNEFTVSLAVDGRFIIFVRRLHGAGPMQGREDDAYLAYDGTDMIWVEYSEAVVGFKHGLPAFVGTKPITNKVNFAWACRGGYPLASLGSGEYRTEILWLAFAAGCYLHDHPLTTMPLPWFTARSDLGAYGYRCEYVLNEKAPYTPSFLKFTRDYHLDLSEAAEMERPELDKPSGEPQVRQWRSELQQRMMESPGSCAGELKVQSLEEFRGFTLPRQFSVKTYTHQRVYEGTVTNLAPLPSNIVCRPPISGPLSLIDSRFRYRTSRREVDHIIEGLEPGNDWPKTTERKLIGTFNLAIADRFLSSRYRPGVVRAIRLATALIFLAAALGAPVLLYRLSRRWTSTHRRDPQPRAQA